MAENQEMQQPTGKTNLAVVGSMQISSGVMPTTFEQLVELSKTLAASELVPNALRGKPANVFVIVAKGLELGLKPMHSLSEIYVVNGRPGCSAALKRALVLTSPHCEYFRCVESTDEKATYVSKRRGQPETSTTYTLKQAQAAGLMSNDNWKKHPAAMLRARSSSAEADAQWPDVVQGMASLEELKEIEGNVVSVKPNRPIVSVAPPPEPQSTVPDEPEDEFDRLTREPPKEETAPTTPAATNGEPTEDEKLDIQIDEATSREQLTPLNNRIKALADVAIRDRVKQHWIRRWSDLDPGKKAVK